jgi:hypothetical protein
MNGASGFVRTSKGIRPASQVIRVRGGARVSRPFSAGTYQAQVLGNLARLAQAADTASGGWVSWADWRNTAADPIVSFVARWTVPPAPLQSNDQTVYLFNALQDAAGNHILQPVLQWGPSPALGSGSQWGAASFWLGGATDPLFCSEFVPLQPGTAVTGRMEVSLQDNGLFSCSCSFDGLPGTELTAENLPPLVDACMTLEAYGIGGGAPYPPTPATDFDSIDVRVGASPAGMSWALYGGASVSSAGVVEVVYPIPPGS